MDLDLLNTDERLVTDHEEEYHALLNALKRTKGFGLFFVQCSLAVGNEIIRHISTDVKDKKVSVLSFQESIKGGNLFKAIESFLNDHQSTKILFVQGIEYSLYDYEETKKRLGWSDEQIYTYTWKDVPDILININQQRERFRDLFKDVELVFLLPLFALKYVISRSPDFFDWRSGKFEFPMSADQVQKANSFFLESEKNREENYSTRESIRSRIIEIQSLLEEENQVVEEALSLLSEQSKLLLKCRDYEAVIANSEKLLKANPEDSDIWTQRGMALSRLDREEEAIESLEKSIELNPQNEDAWIEKGICLRFLEKPSESLSAFKKAIEINHKNHKSWNYMGISYSILKDWKNAVLCYEKALLIKKDFMIAYHNLGNVLGNLGDYQKALETYDSALNVSPDEERIVFDKARTLAQMGCSKEAIKCYSKVIELNPENSTAWHNRALALAGLGRHQEAIQGYTVSIELCKNTKKNPHTSYRCMALSLQAIGRLEESVAALKKSIKFHPILRWAGHFKLAELYFRMHQYRNALIQLIQGLKRLRDTDLGWRGLRESVERHVAIQLNQNHLSFLVPAWGKLLRITRFRSPS